MNAPLYIFIALLISIMGAAGYFFRDVLKVIASLTAEHARTYARSYVKAAALVAITAGAAFKETFQNLTAQQAAALTWWGWAILFWAPITAGLGVVIAFLDTSVATSDAKKKSDEASGTTPPFTPKTP